MKKKLIIIAAAVLAVLIAAGGSWFLFLRDASPSSKPIDVARLTFAGEPIIDTELSDATGDSLPEGWDKTYPYIFLNNADKSTSIQTEGGNNNHISIRQTDEGGVLSFYGRNGANILTLPDLDTEEYVFSFDLSFDAFKTPFGVAVDLPKDYKTANGATIFQFSGIDIDQSEDNTVLVPTFNLYRLTHTKGDADYAGTQKDRVDLNIADYVPDAVVINDAETGEGTVPFDVTLNVKVYHFKNIFYFYVNDVLIAHIEDSDDTPATRVGFFSDTSGREVSVTNLSICELIYASDFTKELYNANTLLSEDFTDTADGSLPEKWKILTKDWIEGSDKGSAEVKNGSLKLNAEDGSVAVVFPQIAFDNTLTQVVFKLNSTKGKIGIIDSISDPLVSSNGGTFATLSLSDVSGNHYNSQSGIVSQLKALALDGEELTLTSEDNVTLSVYRFNGKSFFFVNDIFVSHLSETAPATQKHFAGIFAEHTGDIEVTSVTVTALVQKGITDNAKVKSGEITIGNDSAGMKFKAQINKNDVVFAGAVEGKYSSDSSLKLGIVLVPREEKSDAAISAETKGAVLLEADNINDNSSMIEFSAELKRIPEADLNKYLAVSAYMAVDSGDSKHYFYGKVENYSPAVLASNIYLDQSDSVKANLDTIFKGCSNYVGKYEKSLTFALFSDFHYKAMMYSTSIADLEAIFDRADKAGAAFVLSGGDFCNDFLGSPELTNAFLNNKYNMPAYNIYGNHELESANNSMQVVTPLLTNDENVVWGTKNGKIGNGDIGYYYFESGGFRIVCTDTNYSYNPATGRWEHNTTSSYGPPSGNTQGNSLGPDQLIWLEEVLTEAAYNGTPCIVIGHDSFSGKFRSTSPDAADIREIYGRVNSIRKGTVLMSINGHIHTNNIAVVEDVLYLDMNTTRNGVWKGTGTTHYTEEHTFDYVEYDISGTPVSESKKSLSELSMGDNTWFFEDPLSAIVTVSQYGTITVEGMESSWAYGIVPENTRDDQVPMVSSGIWEMLRK